MRDSIRAIELHKEHQRLSATAAKREIHDDHFEGKYVAAQEATLVSNSMYDTIANTHREELAAKEGQPTNRSGGGKPNWMTFFGNSDGQDRNALDGGFFNGKGWLFGASLD